MSYKKLQRLLLTLAFAFPQAVVLDADLKIQYPLGIPSWISGLYAGCVLFESWFIANYLMRHDK